MHNYLKILFILTFLFVKLIIDQCNKDYLNISESTYKRKVKDGTLKPIKMPGGDRFYKRELLAAFQGSHRRGRT